ncbi:MAG: hypothetical protein QGG42_21745 [Phycisphaerae bacterium]|jgi:hypothetical protein|nr:hypothetical protein [Phycisphaerae bacterium]
MSKGRNKILLLIIPAAVLLIVGYLYVRAMRQLPVGPIRTTISKETTHILGPVNEDGTVNYMAYLNAKHSKGVTRENNAAIPMIDIFGPDWLRKDTGGKIYKILNISPPSAGQKHLTSLEDHVSETLSKEDRSTFWDKNSKLPIHETKLWNAKQYPLVAGWLEDNKGALDAILVAMERPRYYIPAVSYDEDECIATLVRPDVHPPMSASRALTARAMLKVESGDMTGAWADLTAARRLARRVASGYTAIENLLGVWMERKAFSAIREMAGSGKLTSEQAQAFLTDMQSLEPMPDLLDNVNECERFMMLDMVMLIARTTHQEGLGEAMGDIQSGEQKLQSNTRSLEWDRILVRINPWYDNVAAAARHKVFKDRSVALADHDRRLTELSEELYESNTSLTTVWNHLFDPTEAIGNLLIGVFMNSHASGILQRDMARAEGDLSVVTMALAAYRAEKKVYPDKLSQLSPGYLKKVPDDLFIDKPFFYERTGKGYLLYSVGGNMKFEGKKEDQWTGDIVVRVE